MSLAEIIVVVLGGCLFVLSFYFLIKNMSTLFLSMSSRKWVKTKGTIISSDLCKFVDQNSEQYQAKVEYEYKFEMEKYRSTNLYFGYMMTSNFYYHKNIVDKYIPGINVEVYNHPNKPELSTLVVGVQNHLLGRLAFCFAGISVGLVMIITATR